MPNSRARNILLLPVFGLLSAALAACAGDEASKEPEVEAVVDAPEMPDTAPPSALGAPRVEPGALGKIEKLERSNEEWKEVLEPEAFRVLRQAGTERAFTGEYWDEKRAGQYLCRGCQLPLFSSSTKFKSGTGWPSFWQPIRADVIAQDVDHKLGYARSEILCARCEGHLGHVFNDGPEPTGLRYCMNSIALRFVPEGPLGEKDGE